MGTNGIISPQDFPRETQYVDDGFPTDFPVIAPFLADLDTSNGKGAIYYREDDSTEVLIRAAEEVKRGFPESTFSPTAAFIATWDSVGPYEELTRNSVPSNRVGRPAVPLSGRLCVRVSVCQPSEFLNGFVCSSCLFHTRSYD